MNLPVALSLVACTVGVLVTLLAVRFSSAPGWSRYRGLALVALSAALYSALDVFATVDVSTKTFVALSQVEDGAAALHVAAWYSYVRRRIDEPRRLSDRLVRDALLVSAALWLVPGLMVTGEVEHFVVPWLGVRYGFPTTTVLGSLSFVADLLVLMLSILRYVRAARRGLRDARVHVLALVAVFVTAINDALVAGGVLRAPFLLSFGFLAAVGAMGWELTRDFVLSARELDRLSKQLEHDVAERTERLVATEAALLHAEKMAAIGRLAAGVAHEINNPAGAVSANLSYLSEALARGQLPPDASECVAESQEAVARIAKIVAQLLDSSSAAARVTPEDSSVSLIDAVNDALAIAKSRIGGHITTSVEVPMTLSLRVDGSLLVQVLVNLIVNAAQAIPQARAGRIDIRAVNDGVRVRLEVSDNGTGMSDETQRRLFEPFFTTKPHGEGTGLGLSVSLGIVRSMGGEIEVTSSAAGTSMAVLINRATVSATKPAASREEVVSFNSLLVVDDDLAVARAVERSLRSKLDVEIANSVEQALEKLTKRSFDLILSDLQMPDGGGRRLYEDLLERAPELARRVVFFSGGSPAGLDADLIERRGIPLLQKPLVLDELFALARRVCAARDIA